MKKKSLLLLLIALSTATYGQQANDIEKPTESVIYNSTLNVGPLSVKEHAYTPKMNLVKINITGLPIRNYSIQYERVLSKVISIGLSYRNMPEGNLPFKNQILKQIDASDIESRNIINNVTLSNYAITPEVRFYLGKKGYGQGFYIAPFFRNAGYKGNNFDVEYKDENNTLQTLSLSGDIKANTFGLLLGAQWSLSKHIVLDWWILGPHIGNGKGDLIGVSSRPLSSSEQADIKATLEDFEIPMVDKKVTVNSQGATMNLDGSFGGLRAGLLIGIKF